MEKDIKIQIQDINGNEKVLFAEKGSILFDVLIRNGVSMKGNCGKKRACNACLVYFMEEKEWKKSCTYMIEKDVSIEISGLLEEKNMILLESTNRNVKKRKTNHDEKENRDNEKDVKRESENYNQKELEKNLPIHIAKKLNNNIILESDFKKNSDCKKKTKMNVTEESSHSCGMAVDLGTTTIAFLLFDLESMDTIEEFGVMNPQRMHGADVASRITFGSDVSKVRELKGLFEDAFREAMDYFTPHINETEKNLKRIGISGNTVMMHIVQELCLTSLGNYPFYTGNVEEKTLKGEEFFLNEEFKKRFSECEIILTPCSTAYIGGDVLVGTLLKEMDLSNEISLFIDLGTNGEMILGKKGKFYSASTAAGPAFEGSFRTQHLHGSRLIDFLALARKQRWIDEHGKICDRFFEKGIPFEQGTFLTQEVVHFIQLAKSAIYAGILLLCESYHIMPSDISKVYVAGGFGFYLNISNAVYLKMIPKELENKISIVGNSSLIGTKQYMMGKCQERMKKFRDSITNVELSNVKEFQEYYIRYLNF